MRTRDRVPSHGDLQEPSLGAIVVFTIAYCIADGGAPEQAREGGPYRHDVLYSPHKVIDFGPHTCASLRALHASQALPRLTVARSRLFLPMHVLDL